MKNQGFFSQDRLSVFFRHHLFSLNESFITPLSLEECKVFLAQPVPPLPWFFKNYPLQVVIKQESTPDKAKLLFTLYGAASWLPGETTVEIHGNIDFAASETHQVLYNSTINPEYMNGFLVGILMWFLMASSIGGSIWKPLEFLFRIPQSIGDFFAYHFWILVAIFCLIYGMVYLFRILTIRREILTYLDAGLQRPDRE